MKSKSPSLTAAASDLALCCWELAYSFRGYHALLEEEKLFPSTAILRPSFSLFKTFSASPFFCLMAVFLLSSSSIECIFRSWLRNAEEENDGYLLPNRTTSKGRVSWMEGRKGAIFCLKVNIKFFLPFLQGGFLLPSSLFS